METKTSMKKASQDGAIMNRAKAGLEVCYSPVEIAEMDPARILEEWGRVVSAATDAFERSREIFY